MQVDEINTISGQIVDSSMRVHSALGPGLLESVYEKCLQHELQRRGLDVRTQVGFPIVYGDVRIESGLKIDLLVMEQVIVELKAVETLLPVHESQIISYLKITGKRLGLLINFNVAQLKDGIRRFANKL
ncbi:MAG: GxxExxY protein [Pirellulales bacterium]